MWGAFSVIFKQTHLVLLVSAMEWLTFFLGFILQVHIVCRLHHDQLKPVFHVCRRLQQAVSRVFWYALYFLSFFCNPTVWLEYLTMMCRKSAVGNHRCADKMAFAACAFFLSLFMWRLELQNSVQSITISTMSMLFILLLPDNQSVICWNVG